MVSHVFQALGRAVQGTKTAVITFLSIEHRSGYPPASGIQAEKPFTSIGPGTLAGKNKLVLTCHNHLHFKICGFSSRPANIMLPSDEFGVIDELLVAVGTRYSQIIHPTGTIRK
jgi:hypothetical protein